MPGETVRFEGEKRLARQLKKLDVEAPKLLRLVHRDAAALVADEMRNLAPVKSGKLRRSIRVSATRTSGTVKIGGTKLVPYAGPIIGGWSAHGITANKFPWKALDNKRLDVVALHAVRVNELVEKTITRTGAD